MAVLGVGRLGLAAAQIASALGARVVAVDINPAALRKAETVGADAVVDGTAGDPGRAHRTHRRWRRRGDRHHLPPGDRDPSGVASAPVAPSSRRDSPIGKSKGRSGVAAVLSSRVSRVGVGSNSNLEARWTPIWTPLPQHSM